MSKQPPSSKASTTEQILDLLLDALVERQAVRGEEAGPAPGTPSSAPPTPSPSLEPVAQEPTTQKARAKDRPPTPKPAKQPPTPEKQPPQEPRPGEKGWTPPALLPSINLGRTLARLLLVLLILIVLANIPVTRYGTSLARIMPDTTALIIRDGLVVKGSGPEIYVLEDNKLRWISSLEAFDYFDYRWEQVHLVDDSFLEDFEQGQPLHVLLKCQSSPHVYALENGKKRWIRDIPTFETQGYVWEDVKFVTCDHLRRLPDGPPIPEDAGPPPQP